MNEDLPGLPRARNRTDQVVVREVGDELVLFNLERQTFHTLSRVASSIWRWSDGETGTDEMARRLARMHRLGAAEAKALVDGPPPAPVSVDRRALLRRIARAALAPAVATMLAPTRVAAVSICAFCSCFTAGSPCRTTAGGSHRACRNVATGNCQCFHFLCPPGYLYCGNC